MKTITLTEGEERYTVNIVYSIFDIGNPLLADNFECNANNAQDALKQYNKSHNKNIKYKRTDAYSLLQDATVCVSTQFYDKHGTRYKYGRRTWFKEV